MSFVIMTVGKTHSGKTTFGKKLAAKLKHTCLLDSDEIAVFLKEKFPELYGFDFTKNSNELSAGYYLKLKVLLDIYEQALKTNLPIISTSANSDKSRRAQIRKLAKKAKRQLILVYFNLPEEILLKRIKTTNRSKDCLNYSQDFTDLLINKQKERFEVPNKKEADYFLEITDDTSCEKVFKDVIKILKTKN